MAVLPALVAVSQHHNLHAPLQRVPQAAARRPPHRAVLHKPVPADGAGGDPEQVLLHPLHSLLLAAGGVHGEVDNIRVREGVAAEEVGQHPAAGSLRRLPHQLSPQHHQRVELVPAGHHLLHQLGQSRHHTPQTLLPQGLNHVRR